MKHDNPKTWPAWISLVACLILTLLGTAYTKVEVEKKAKAAFLSTCGEIKLKIEQRLRSHKQLLRGGAGLFDASDDISREQWRAYALTIDLGEWFSDIQGLGYAQLIPARDLVRHSTGIRAEGFPDYRVWPGGGRDLYSSIVYIEPFTDSNLRVFGYDMLSEPLRKAAMIEARDREVAVLTGRERLVAERGIDLQNGIVMFFPVYDSGLPHATVKQRRQSILGWVFCPIRMDDFMKGILGNQSLDDRGQIRYQVYDGDRASIDALLFDSKEPSQDGQESAPRFSLKIGMDSAAHPWTLLFTQSGNEAFSSEYGKIWLTFFGGSIVTFLLFRLVLSLLTTSYTARRMADRLTAALIEHNTELEKRVAERTAELAKTIAVAEEARKLAEDANKAKSDFLSSMSHELRTPMNAVLGFGQLLEQDSDLQPEHLEFVEEIMKGGRHLLDLINEVLDLSRIESGKIELSTESVSCEEIIREGLDLIAPLAEQRRISIGCEVKATPRVIADRVRFKQALVNLLSNAVKYSKEAGRVKVDLSTVGKMARIEVSDRGIGIPAESMPGLFTPFNRLGRDSGETEGTGIGLVISKRLIELMGGSIGAESEEGKGSLFWIELPLATAVPDGQENSSEKIGETPAWSGK